MIGGKMVTGTFFDYYALAEDLVNGRILEDEDEASIVCEYVESQVNEAGEWEGEYTSEEGVVITYMIEPVTVKTDDGATLTRQPNGSYTGGERPWSNWKELKESC